MQVELIDSVEEFIAATTAFRALDPLRTNVIGSVSLSVADGDRSYDAYHWWTVRDDAGEVIGIAMRTSPFNLVVSSMPTDAAHLLGVALARHDDTVPGVIGPNDTVDALVAGYVTTKSPGSTRDHFEQRRDLLYELEELVTPDVDGIGRPAREDEAELLAQMYVAFADEAAIPPITIDEARAMTARHTRHQSLFCWEVDGHVVSFAGHAPLVATGEVIIGRVGPVYTPPEHRRHGYGSAVTAHVSRHVLEKGARVMLFTDAANPTSNAIYQVIGYRLIDEMIQMGFREP
ncbi:MAG: GNAT family N-acetyltransferase [Acidimicrobiales bacterium]